MNISGELVGLFKEWMENRHKSVSSPYNGAPNIPSVNRRESYYNNYRNGGYGLSHTETNKSDEIVVYFFEWSNLDNLPRAFYTMNAFENFLKSSGIFIQLYEKDIVRNLSKCYITCYRGTKDLCIRSNKENLIVALSEHDRIQSDIDKFKTEELKKNVKENGGILAPTCHNEDGYNGPWYG